MAKIYDNTPKEYDGKTFYPLKGLGGYYATEDGLVLGTRKGTKILKTSSQDSYHFCIGSKIKNLARAHVAFMVQNNCAIEEIPEKYVYIDKDGKARTVSERDRAKAMKPKVPAETALQRMSFMENELGILKRFYATNKIKEMQDYLKGKTSLLVAYAMRTLSKGVASAKELVQDAITEFYIALYRGLAMYSIFSYVKKIMRTIVATEKKRSKHYQEVDDYSFDVLSSRY